MQISYVIVKEASVEAIEKRVTQLMNEYYIVHGPLQIVNSVEGQARIYIQALIKSDDWAEDDEQ